MRILVIGFGLLALLSGCVSVHVHFPKAEPAKQESPDAPDSPPPAAKPASPS